MRILVVEDDPILSDGLKAGLGMFGATLDVVANCADGRAALATSEFDALVLDLMLPDGSGLDLLAHMRAGGDLTPVLLLTALDEISDRVKGLDAGADDYLGKPFDLDELGARLRAIGRRQAGPRFALSFLQRHRSRSGPHVRRGRRPDHRPFAPGVCGA